MWELASSGGQGEGSTNRSLSRSICTLRSDWRHIGSKPRRTSSLRACKLSEKPENVQTTPLSSFFNPLTTEFFPPRQHIFMHSAHTTFVGTPLPQHSLLSGQTWWGPHTWRDPSGNTVNDIHDPPQGQQSEVKGGCQPDFRPAFP